MQDLIYQLHKSDMIIKNIWPVVPAKKVFYKPLKLLRILIKPAGTHRKRTKEIPSNKEPLEDEIQENVVTTSDIFMRIERHNANGYTSVNSTCDNSLALGYTNTKTDASQFRTCRDGGVVEMKS